MIRIQLIDIIIMNMFLSCIGLTCCSCLCCECNCCIFPAPNASYGEGFCSESQSRTIKLHSFRNEKGETVPYMEISTPKSRLNKDCMLYFHGNAEDIGHATAFLGPIVSAGSITLYVMEYPTYGIFNDCYPWRISNQIKTNSVQFHDHIKKKYSITKEQIYIMGRSIGSGPATYTAARVGAPLLILISPFDTIKSTAMDFATVGCLVKQHFDNLEQIAKFKGSLLIVHGKIDEVIQYKHGAKLYQRARSQGITAVMNSPERMSHNIFNHEVDIVQPTIEAVNEMRASKTNKLLKET